MSPSGGFLRPQASQQSPVEGKTANPGPTQAGAERHPDIDRQWDAVVAALPDDIREYVVRDKVPTVRLETNAAGKSRLCMTFDRPLSQHAFALAVASDEKYNGQKAANVVLHAVRGALGDAVMIAPTSVAANGEKVESTRRLTVEQLAQIKRQIVLAKAGQAAAGLSHAVLGHMGQAKESADHGSSAAPESDDPTHRGEGPAGRNQGRADPADDARAAGVAAAHGDPSNDDDDPWAHPQPPRPDASRPVGDPHADGDGTVHRHKHVAVPDMSDDSDPWAVQEAAANAPVVSVSGQDMGSGQSGRENMRPNMSTQANHGRDAGPIPLQPIPTQSTPSEGSSGNGGSLPAQTGEGGREQSDSAGSSSRGGNGLPPLGVQRAPRPLAQESSMRRTAATDGSQPESPDGPRVAPEDDEYSMSDQSLGDASAMSPEELGKLFEVKKVEKFAADDPNNPKNIRPNHKHQEG